MSEIPVRSAPRRLAGWINLTDARKVHSLVELGSIDTFRFAQTQVVEGFGAKDLVTGVQQWFLDLMEQLVEQLGDKVRKPDRVPVKRRSIWPVSRASLPKCDEVQNCQLPALHSAPRSGAFFFS